MKYMGNKDKLLPILGEILQAEAKQSARIADPFCGSGAVSWFLAQQTNKIIYSGDLQSFAVARAAAVIERTTQIDTKAFVKSWFKRAQGIVDTITSQFPNAERSIAPQTLTFEEIQGVVTRSRAFCHFVLPPLLEKLGGEFPMTLAYGGHYFSPLQAIELDALRQTIPRDPDKARIGIAALIEVAGRCAASPGHTAQPFQPTESAAKFIAQSWNKDIWTRLERAVVAIADVHAHVKGRAIRGDYKKCIDQLDAGDLVFADPPYSDVHYSRFYHVLETLTRGAVGKVSGIGRYPCSTERPTSSFSRRSESHSAAHTLIDACAEKELRLVLTFPSTGASNGLTIDDFVKFAKGKFSSIEVQEVTSAFSTLGGTASNRGGRKNCTESIACFRP